MDYKKKDKVIPLFYPILPIFFNQKKYEGGKKTLTIIVGYRMDNIHV